MERLVALAGPYPALTLGALALLALLSTGLLVARRHRGAVPFLPRRLSFSSSSPDRAETYKPKHDARLGDAASVFPPLRRAALARLVPGAARRPEPKAAELRARQLPTTRTPDPARAGYLTPTGLALDEVRALGPFPDYAALSGVPAPRPVDPAFDITKAVFRPFRPFRWAYHQTMALMKLEPDYWIELEQNYHRRMAQRQELRRAHGDMVLFWRPGSELACRELMEMVLQFLVARYPQYFSLEAGRDAAGEKPTHWFRNRLLDTVSDVDVGHPLEVLFDHVPEDFAIMCRSEEDGMYYLRAAMICSSVGWAVGLHKDKVLRDIHAHVPQWEEKMAFSVDRWFTKLATDQPVQRCSWGIEDWEAFYCPPGTERSAFAADPGRCTAADLQVRCDWQTLRRLPVSGAVIFNFKAVFTPFEALADEPRVPALVHKILAEGRRDLIEYKMEPHVEALAKDRLARWADQQVRDGRAPAGWDPATLEEHPFFPGWKEKVDFPACPCV